MKLGWRVEKCGEIYIKANLTKFKRTKQNSVNLGKFEVKRKNLAEKLG